MARQSSLASLCAIFRHPTRALRSVLRDDFRSLAPHTGAGWSTNLAADATTWRKLVAGTSAERLNR